MERVTAQPARLARLAGLLYLVIIVCGVGGEAFLRGPLVDRADAAATAANLGAAGVQFRLGILCDVVMALADVGLAALLYLLFEPVSRGLSLAAMVFRLVQASILGLNLLALLQALSLVAESDIPGRDALLMLYLQGHAIGYDLGLFFFGVSCLLTAALILRASFIPRPFAALMAGAGLVYLVGSTLRVLAPAESGSFEPAYGLPLLAELSFCLWLMARAARIESAREWSTQAVG